MNAKDSVLNFTMSAFFHFDGTMEKKGIEANRVIIGYDLFKELCAKHNEIVLCNGISEAALTKICGSLVVVDRAKGRERVFEVCYAQSYEIPKGGGETT